MICIIRIITVFTNLFETRIRFCKYIYKTEFRFVRKIISNIGYKRCVCITVLFRITLSWISCRYSGGTGSAILKRIIKSIQSAKGRKISTIIIIWSPFTWKWILRKSGSVFCNNIYYIPDCLFYSCGAVPEFPFKKDRLITHN